MSLVNAMSPEEEEYVKDLEKRIDYEERHKDFLLRSHDKLEKTIMRVLSEFTDIHREWENSIIHYSYSRKTTYFNPGIDKDTKEAFKKFSDLKEKLEHIILHFSGN
jgi:hypothetical protein